MEILYNIQNNISDVMGCMDTRSCLPGIIIKSDNKTAERTLCKISKTQGNFKENSSLYRAETGTKFPLNDFSEMDIKRFWRSVV